MSFTAGSLVGEYKHKLTVAELASHTHKTTYKYGCETVATNGGGSGWTRFTCNNNNDGVDATGGNQAHNNIQPSIVVYIFRRTA